MSRRRIIGIDIGGTNFRIGAVGPEGELTRFRKIPVGQVFRTEAPLDDLATFLKSYCAILAGDGLETEGIAIGFPATLDRERKRVLQAPNIPFLEDLPVVEDLTRRLGVPVVIERDVVMAVFYDREKYHVPAEGITVGVYFGTGIGSAIFLDGTPLAGKNGVAGEVGHIPVDGSELLCGCGNRGCMESLAGGRYLTRLCETVYPGTPIGRLFTEHGDEALLRQFVDRMAMAVATEVNILDPDTVLVGGGVPDMADFPGPYLLERIMAHTRKPFPAQGLHILFTDDEEAKCVIGAARYGRRRLEGTLT